MRLAATVIERGNIRYQDSLATESAKADSLAISETCTHRQSFRRAGSSRPQTVIKTQPGVVSH